MLEKEKNNNKDNIKKDNFIKKNIDPKEQEENNKIKIKSALKKFLKDNTVDWFYDINNEKEIEANLFAINLFILEDWFKNTIKEITNDNKRIANIFNVNLISVELRRQTIGF